MERLFMHADAGRGVAYLLGTSTARGSASPARQRVLLDAKPLRNAHLRSAFSGSSLGFTPASVVPSACKRLTVCSAEPTNRRGEPIVQDSISYSQLLTAMRRREVQSVKLTDDRSGRGLVLLKSGRAVGVEYPLDDPRFLEAMADCSVPYSMLIENKVTQAAADNVLAGSEESAFFEFVVPVILLMGFVVFINKNNEKRPDKEDRAKLSKMEMDDRKKKKRTYKVSEGRKQVASGDTDAAESFGLSSARVMKATKKSGLAADGRSVDNKEGKGKGDEEEDEDEDEDEELVAEKEERVTFDDVAGIGEAKLELMEVVDFFTKPEKFIKSGSRIPGGILLCGPPGTGKTLLAKAVATEAGCTFFSIAASEFVEVYVGVGAARVRDMFQMARKRAPSIVFIDEMDAVARARGSGVSRGGGTEEREQCLNQLLIEMDGFDSKRNVIVLGATNRPDLLDKAILRPGRFDRKVTVGLPNFEGRVEILKVHAKKYPIESSGASPVDLLQIASATAGFSGAALANLLNTAALLSAKGSRRSVTMDDLREAIDLETLGRTREVTLSTSRRQLLALREAAQAVCAVGTPFKGIERQLDLISIIPREGHPFGQTKMKSNEQLQAALLFSRSMMLDQIVTLLSGRAAEEVVYGKDMMSTAGQDNLERARLLAQKMVLMYGMSSSFGPGVALGAGIAGNRFLKEKQTVFILTTSEETNEAVDQEVREILERCYAIAMEMVVRNRPLVDALVSRLLDKGLLEKGELDEVFAAHPMQHVSVDELWVEALTVKDASENAAAALPGRAAA
eukprot:jgi/Mesvir1/19120/Mv12862-RA.1